MPSRPQHKIASVAPPAGEAAAASFADDVAAGLGAQPKSLPCRYFYDARGSELFEEITRLPEYYPTSVETGILSACVFEFAQSVPTGAVLVELGSGSSVKTEILLEALPALACYVPVDVSDAAVEAAAARLARRFPQLPIRPVVGDFTQPLAMPDDLGVATRIGFFPGSTIGNFAPDEASALLAAFRSTLGPGARLLIGADLRKDPAVLIPAYDDAAGVTAEFNLNLLRRINRELGGNFDPARFRHLIRYDEARGRIEMHLESTCDQVVTIGSRRYCFRAGETIHTENSHKFTLEGFEALARTAGWQPRKVWTDARAYFSVHDLAAD